MDADYLDWALADFSGYSAVDELYDGPFCVRGVVRLTDALRLAGEAPRLVSRPNNWLRIVYLTRNNESNRELAQFHSRAGGCRISSAGENRAGLETCPRFCS